MSRVALFVAAGVAFAHLAHAQPAPDAPPVDESPDIIERARKALVDGRYEEARELFTQAYELAPLPKILFALGQIEFNLNNFQAAIDYYQRFLDSNPDPREAALAQQAIGAARARLAAPTPPPVVIEREAPVPRYERDWDVWSTSLVSVGGAAMIAGSIVLVHGYRMRIQDPDEKLSMYSDRLARSKRWQWTGVGIAAAGAALVGAAFVRFAVHRVEVLPITPSPSPGAVGVAVERSW